MGRDEGRPSPNPIGIDLLSDVVDDGDRRGDVFCEEGVANMFDLNDDGTVGMVGRVAAGLGAGAEDEEVLGAGVSQARQLLALSALDIMQVGQAQEPAFKVGFKPAASQLNPEAGF